MVKWLVANLDAQMAECLEEKKVHCLECLKENH